RCACPNARRRVQEGHRRRASVAGRPRYGDPERSGRGSAVPRPVRAFCAPRGPIVRGRSWPDPSIGRARRRNSAPRRLRRHPRRALRDRLRSRGSLRPARLRCGQRHPRSSPERARRAALAAGQRSVTLPPFVRRVEAAGIGFFSGIAVAWLVGDANYVALGAAGLFALLVFLLTRALTPAGARHDVYLLVFFALT